MSTLQKDFDRIALASTASPDGSLQNCHYHNFLLRHLPPNCERALEIGCGKGEFSRRLAAASQSVLAIDLSPEMIRIARANSGHLSNLEFRIADVMSYELLPEHFDCVATLATLHHLPLREILLKMKAALKPGGVLLILDLFEPARLWRGSSPTVRGVGERELRAPGTPTLLPLPPSATHSQAISLYEGLLDRFLNAVAIPVSVSLRLIHHGRLLPSREVRAAWAAHEVHDTYPTMKEVRALCADILLGAKVKKHLLWRYSIIWQKSRFR